MTGTPYTVEGSEFLYRGRVIGVRRDTLGMGEGSTAVREVVEHPGAVAVVALDEDGRVLLVNQYRHPVRQRLDELPAGLLDVDGESALVAAQRELAEEAGTAAQTWHVLVDLHTSPGMTDEAIRVYLARDLRDAQAPDGFAAEHEEVDLTVTRVRLEDAVARVLSGEITNAAAAAGLLAAAHARAEGWTGLRAPEAPWPARPDRAGS